MKSKICIILISILILTTSCSYSHENNRDVAIKTGIELVDLNIDISSPKKLIDYADIIVIGSVISDNDMVIPGQGAELNTKIELKVDKVIKGADYIDEKTISFYSASGYVTGKLYNQSKPKEMLEKYGYAPDDKYVLIQNQNCIIPEIGDKLCVFIKKDTEHFDYSIGFHEGIMYVKDNKLLYNEDKPFEATLEEIISISNGLGT
jgi:hypothetical protein